MKMITKFITCLPHGTIYLFLEPGISSNAHAQYNTQAAPAFVSTDVIVWTYLATLISRLIPLQLLGNPGHMLVTYTVSISSNTCY